MVIIWYVKLCLKLIFAWVQNWIEITFTLKVLRIGWALGSKINENNTFTLKHLWKGWALGLKYVTRQMWSWGRDNKFCNINPASKFFSRYNLPSRSRLAREGFHAGWKPLKMGCEPGLPRTPKRKLHHLEEYGSVVLLLVRQLFPDWGHIPSPGFLVTGRFSQIF